MRQQVVLFKKWLGELVDEGPEQSMIKILEGGSLKGQTLCFSNTAFAKMKERKSAGPTKSPDYPERAGAKPGRTRVEDNEEAANPTGGEETSVDYLTQYNQLVEEAKSIGLNSYKPVKVKFRDEETGAKRCEALAEAIEAHKAKVASGDEAAPTEDAKEEEAEPASPEVTPPNQEKKKMAKTATAKKAKKAAPAKKAAKTPTAKKAAPATKERSNAPVAAIEFGTREGTNRETAVLYLVKHKNKEVKLGDLAKEVYGKNDDENRLKAKAVIVGMNMMIENKNLPYKQVEFSGRGEDATLILATKSGR